MMAEVKKSYYDVNDVMEILGCGENKAYGVIRKLNKELEKKGYIFIAGKINKAYFNEKYMLN